MAKLNVSVVIPTLGRADLVTLLLQLEKQKEFFSEVFVSYDLHRRGAGYARNKGISCTNSERIVMLDDDIQITDSYGIVLHRHLIKFGREFKVFQGKVRGGINTKYDKFTFIGCHMILHRSEANERRFDESYIGGEEDVDFFWSVLDSGKKVGYLESLAVVHEAESRSESYRAKRQNREILESKFPERAMQFFLEDNTVLDKDMVEQYKRLFLDD